METLKTMRQRADSTCGWTAGYEMHNKATVMPFSTWDGLVPVLIIVWTGKEFD